MFIIKEIKKNMQGLFANQSFTKGSLVLILQGEKFSNPSRTSIQIQDKHIEDSKGSYMNHHCSPNVEIKINFVEIICNFINFVDNYVLFC